MAPPPDATAADARVSSRLERCALCVAFLLSETTQDAFVAASALVAVELFGGYAESLFILLLAVMLFVGCHLSTVVGRYGWTSTLAIAAACGAAGLACVGLALDAPSHTAAALAVGGSVLLGAHRAAHMLYRFAALELGGVACLGEMFCAATIGGLLGPQLLIVLGLRGGLLAAAAVQLVVAPPAILAATRAHDASTAAERALPRAAAERSGSLGDALKMLRTHAESEPALRLALIAGVVSWCVMLLVTVPAAAIAVTSFGLSTPAAIRALQAHDFLMNAPGPATASLVERVGAKAAIAAGLVLYVVCVLGLWACGSDEVLYPEVEAGDPFVQRVFVALVVALALGWNLMWLASTSALDAAARAVGATSCAQIAKIRTANEFVIYAACVAFLLVSLVSRDRYKDIIAISAPFLALVGFALYQARDRPAAAFSPVSPSLSLA